jgi:flagellar biosynthesis/type III secretory pathway M-ring protein FliF/YscJ
MISLAQHTAILRKELSRLPGGHSVSESRIENAAKTIAKKASSIEQEHEKTVKRMILSIIEKHVGKIPKNGILKNTIEVDSVHGQAEHVHPESDRAKRELYGRHRTVV